MRTLLLTLAHSPDIFSVISMVLLILKLTGLINISWWIIVLALVLVPVTWMAGFIVMMKVATGSD